MAARAPLSLATCAKVLRDAGFEPSLNDCAAEGRSLDDLKRLAASLEPALAVVYVGGPAVESDVRTAELLKEACPGVTVAALGIHPTALPEHCLGLSGALDVAIRAEPEYALRDLAARIRDGGSFSDVPGLSLREGGRVRHNPDRPFIANLDELAYPAWDLLDTDNYRTAFTGGKCLPVGISRGCEYPCAFCADKAYYGTRLRLRSPESVVDELERNAREFDVHQAQLSSESFTVSRKFATAVAEEILKRKLSVRWTCNSRFDNVNMDFLTKARKAGLGLIGFGIESGVEEVLEGADKMSAVEQAVEAVKMCRKAGVAVVAHVVLGFPGETMQTVVQTVEFVRDLEVDFAQLYYAVGFPGGGLHRHEGESAALLADEGGRFEQNFSVITSPMLSPDHVAALRKKAYRSFYLSSRSLVSSLKDLRILEDVRNVAETAVDFFRSH
jgi:radical SAM superfamily enzyme YgiQ (UPF0313 family)